MLSIIKLFAIPEDEAYRAYAEGPRRFSLVLRKYWPNKNANDTAA